MSADAVEDKPAVAAGKDLETAGMAQVAQGITQTLDELRSEFSSFCERWDWGVRSLVFQANAFAQPVGLAAGLLYETDQYVSGSVKVLSWGSWLGFGWVGVSA